MQAKEGRRQVNSSRSRGEAHQQRASLPALPCRLACMGRRARRIRQHNLRLEASKHCKARRRDARRGVRWVRECPSSAESHLQSFPSLPEVVQQSSTRCSAKSLLPVLAGLLLSLTNQENYTVHTTQCTTHNTHTVQCPLRSGVCVVFSAAPPPFCVSSLSGWVGLLHPGPSPSKGNQQTKPLVVVAPPSYSPFSLAPLALLSPSVALQDSGVPRACERVSLAAL